LRRRCRAINPETYLVGEVWGDARRWLQGDQFDAVMHYELTRVLFGFVAAETLNREQIGKGAYRQIASLSAEEFGKTIDRLYGKYHPAVTDVQFTLLGSHDPARVLTLFGEDESALRLALLFQMTYLGAPCIYYGDEIGLTGNHDPDNRRAMPWHTPKSWNTELFTYTQSLIRLRREHAALRRGSFKPLLARDGIYAYARVLGDECWIVALNVNKHTVKLRLPTIKLPHHHSECRDMLNGQCADIGQQQLSYDIAARSGALLQF